MYLEEGSAADRKAGKGRAVLGYSSLTLIQCCGRWGPELAPVSWCLALRTWASVPLAWTAPLRRARAAGVPILGLALGQFLVSKAIRDHSLEWPCAPALAV